MSEVELAVFDWVLMHTFGVGDSPVERSHSLSVCHGACESGLHDRSA
jgi:hypothetical protein